MLPDFYEPIPSTLVPWPSKSPSNRKCGRQDVILAVNGKRIHDYKLQEILEMLNERKGKRVRVLIERYDKDILYSFVLKDMFETKKP